MTGRLRIACYGFAERNAGSISSAGFVVLDELLSRGHEIDFFGKRTFVYPQELERHPSYRFVDVDNSRERAAAWLATRFRNRIWRLVFGKFQHALFARAVLRAMRRAHPGRDYHVELFLGDWAFGRIEGVPVVSWVQGAPGTDGRSIQRNAKQLLRLCGRKEYWMLRLYAWVRETFDLPAFGHTDRVIVGSSVSAWLLTGYGIPASRVRALAYPLNLSEFSPVPRPPAGDAAPTVLWLGRIVPRKRLDLFLEACALILASGTRLKVRVIGGFPFASGYRRLLDDFPFPAALEYTPRVDRTRVPALLRAVDLVVQPSEEEDFGSTVAEALACGTPVVVGATNGTKDYVGDSGVVCSSYDARSLADAISQALSTRALDPARTSNEARKVAEANFTPARVVDELENILQEAVASGRVEAPDRSHPVEGLT